jgi:hypothetical protein
MNAETNIINVLIEIVHVAVIRLTGENAESLQNVKIGDLIDEIVVYLFC